MHDLELTGKYFLDIPQLDEQHQQLINMINRLHLLIVEKGTESEVTQIIEEFISYTKIHFAEEEGMMARSGFPSVVAHQQVHKTFINEINTIIKKFTGNKFLRFKFFNLAMDLLMNHIETEDQRFAEYYKSAKVSAGVAG